jgi:mannosyl-3-phosphoglycerate phosphatase
LIRKQHDSSSIKPQPQTVVVTDLDGTLLDHTTYSYAPAIPALNQLASQAIPVVFCSSKTAAEMIPLRAELGIKAPYIVENGSAVCDVVYRNGASMKVLGCDVSRIRDFLHQCRTCYGFRFTFFGEMELADVVAATGLSRQQARLAADRRYSEPLIWQGSEHQLSDFLKMASEAGLSAQQGGRFLTLSGLCSKGLAVTWLRDHYERSTGMPVRIVALGDSPNDESLLNAADIAVIVQSAKSSQLRADNARHVVRTSEPGPTGWCNAILQILDTGWRT